MANSLWIEAGLAFVTLSLGPAVLIHWFGFVGDSVEYFGELEESAILLEIQSFPLAFGIE